MIKYLTSSIYRREMFYFGSQCWRFRPWSVDPVAFGCVVKSTSWGSQDIAKALSSLPGFEREKKNQRLEFYYALHGHTPDD